jgi:Uma2 family endonuclease
MLDALTVKLDPLTLTDDQFFQLCSNNRDLRFERNAQGDLVIMPPTGGETGNRNAEICYQLYGWNRQTQRGMTFDSSTGFILPNTATRSPDAAWISLEKWQSLTPAQRQKFLPLCPDFVIELRSPTDTLPKLQEKMQEYTDNGTQLGWLIDRQNRTVAIYQPGRSVEVLNNPDTLIGDPVLPGFVLDLTTIW